MTDAPTTAPASPNATAGAEAPPDATALAELVCRGEVSPAELVEETIGRIERLDPVLGAVTVPMFPRARTHARAPLPDGPFRGVPLLLKDLGALLSGERYTAGMGVLRSAGYKAGVTSHVTQRFDDAGFVICGRTNAPELGLTVTTEPVATGPTRNPWDPQCSTGGSSGGSAAAVAAGLVTVAHAGDGGGSIRIPASECALVGLKPSRGRISHGPVAGQGWAGAATDGVLTRSVRDTAALLDVLAGPEPGDPYTAPPPLRPYRDEVGAAPGALRIGVVDALGGPAHPSVGAAVRSAADLLAELGHAVTDGHPTALEELDGLGRSQSTVIAVHVAAEVAAYEAELGSAIDLDDLEHETRMFTSWGRQVEATRYVDALDWQHAWTRRLLSWWRTDDRGSGFDLLLCPTTTVPPPPLGWLSDPATSGTRVRDMIQFTSPFNTSGQPAISLPLWWDEDGLPIGVQLVAAANREDVLVRIAAQLEAARPWAYRTPPIFATSGPEVLTPDDMP
ncbi:MAG: amidase [Actinomycetota bacterium]|nr:amidase [Actinomycetota bacterium]